MPAARLSPITLAVSLALLALLSRPAAAQLAPDYPTGGNRAGTAAPDPSQPAVTTTYHSGLSEFILRLRSGFEASRWMAASLRRPAGEVSLARSARRKIGS